MRGCCSPFMNSQAPISSPDSAAILIKIHTGYGWVVASWGHPPPGASPQARSQEACSPEPPARAREAAGADGEDGWAVSAPGAPGTFRGQPEPAPRGAYTLRTVAARTRTRLQLLRRRRRAWETQTSSDGRAKSFPGSQSGHGGGDVWPRSRRWLLWRQPAGLRCPRAGSSCSGPSFSTSFRQQRFLLLPLGPPPHLPPRPPQPPPLSRLRGHPLKGQLRSFLRPPPSAPRSSY